MKRISLYIMASLYTMAGLMHFIKTEFYMKIMPPYVPYHLFMVYTSGVAEIVLGILLFKESTRKLAAWGIILLLLAVFPANIYHYISWSIETGLEKWQLAMRLPMQVVMIAWAYWYTREDVSQ